MLSSASNLFSGSDGRARPWLAASGDADDVGPILAAWNDDSSVTRPGFPLPAPAFRDAEGRVRYVGFFGPLLAHDGYGSGSITILRALTQLGIQARINRKGAFVPTELPPDVRIHLDYRDFRPRLELIHLVPTAFRESDAPIRVGWTMYETTQIPSGDHVLGDWPPLLNTVDALVVPCAHNQRLFEQCGVTRPITIIPYGLDCDMWPFRARAEHRPFTVVQYGVLSNRKGPWEAIAAFQQAFPNQTDVRLILKTRNGAFGDGLNGLPSFGDWRIQGIDAIWRRAELLAWLYAADAFIWLSRGEGFGFPPLQAALTGLPVVMTTHTGMAEYYHPDKFYGVGSIGMSASDLGGEWYEPSIADAAAHLRAIYEDRAEARARAEQAALYVRQHFSLSAFASRIIQFLDGF